MPDYRDCQTPLDRIRAALEAAINLLRPGYPRSIVFTAINEDLQAALTRQTELEAENTRLRSVIDRRRKDKANDPA